MWILLSAIATASILGSMHCVGMCGPLALWASGSGQTQHRPQVVRATALYHIGRLLTYIVVGALAGTVGQLADFGGEALGVQLFAARIAGAAMITVGVWELWQLIQLRRNERTSATRPKVETSPIQAPKTSLVAGLLVKLRPFIFKQTLSVRALLTGLLTVLLPCGWLYIFALAAAGSGSSAMGALVMTAFWIGTVPALVGLVASSALMASRFRRAVPALAALVLIAGGCFTASGRGFAALQSWADISPAIGGVIGKDAGITESQSNEALADQIEELTKTPLPCCVLETTSGDSP